MRTHAHAHINMHTHMHAHTLLADEVNEWYS